MQKKVKENMKTYKIIIHLLILATMIAGIWIGYIVFSPKELRHECEIDKVCRMQKIENGFIWEAFIYENTDWGAKELKRLEEDGYFRRGCIGGKDYYINCLETAIDNYNQSL